MHKGQIIEFEKLWMVIDVVQVPRPYDFLNH